MIKIFVTGGGGFIGRQVLPALVELGFDVHASHIEAEPPLTADGVTWHRADLLASGGPADVMQRVRPLVLLHVAWYAAHGEFWTSPENARWVDASLELVRAFRGAGGARIVVAGTCAEYAWGGTEPLHESTTPLQPKTPYGSAKDALRRAVEAYARDEGIAWAWGRIFLLYGPHEDPRRFVPSVARALLRGDDAPCTHGRQVRDFLHVGDVGRAFGALARSDVTGAINIASGLPVTLASVATELQRLVGGAGRVQLDAIPARPHDPSTVVADVTRLSEEVGFRPRFSLTDGLRDTIAWLRE